MIRLGRVFAVALLLSALLPGIALAGETDDQPLAELPKEYAPAVDAVADHLGVTAGKLTSASSDELETLLCSKLGDSSPDEIVASAKEALVQAPQQQLENLTTAQRARLEARLPSLISELQAKYCSTANGAGSGGGAPAGAGGSDDSEPGSAPDGSGSDGAESDGGESDGAESGGAESSAPTSASGIPVPTRVDTGGGGAGDGAVVPLAFGGLFAALFGLFGVGMVRRQRHS